MPQNNNKSTLTQIFETAAYIIKNRPSTKYAAIVGGVGLVGAFALGAGVVGAVVAGGVAAASTKAGVGLVYAAFKDLDIPS